MTGLVDEMTAKVKAQQNTT